MKQHLPVIPTSLSTRETWVGGTAKAEIDPARIMQARAAMNVLLFLAFDRVVMERSFWLAIWLVMVILRIWVEIFGVDFVSAF
jgi:hypothetical protein